MNIRPLALATLVAGLSSAPVIADETGELTVFGNLRVGFIEAEDDMGVESSGSAVGGWVGFVTPNWNNLSAGVTVFATGELFDEGNGDFFASDNGNYAIVGEAYVQGTFGQTTAKVGRYLFDSPHADTDDIRMVPNTFQGALLTVSDRHYRAIPRSG